MHRRGLFIVSAITVIAAVAGCSHRSPNGGGEPCYGMLDAKAAGESSDVTKLEFRRGYTKLKTEVTADQPLSMTLTHEEKCRANWLLPTEATKDDPLIPAKCSVVHASDPVMDIEEGAVHIIGNSPVVTTKRIRAVGVGNVSLIVEIDPGPDRTKSEDDIHRVYLLETPDQSITIFALNDTTVLTRLEDANTYIETTTSGVTEPAKIDDTNARKNFCIRSCKKLGNNHTYPHDN